MSKGDFLKKLDNLNESILPSFQSDHLKTSLAPQPINDDFRIPLNMELLN
jgi:hypothetical protein